MPRSGGIYSLPPGYLAVAGETILPSNHNPPLEDIAQALTDSLPRDGSAGMTGDLPMGNNQITGLGAATAGSHAIRYDQAAKGAYLLSVSTLTPTTNEMIYASGLNVAAKTALTPFARNILDDVDAVEVRSTINAAGSGIQINPGDGLQGGGNLTANRTLAVDGTVVRTTRQIVAGNGMTGGGDFTANRAITLGTPTSITPTGGNTVTATSHTHDLPENTVRSLIAGGTAGTIGTYAMLRLNPGGSATHSQNIPASAIAQFSNASGDGGSGSPSGTWQCMGYASGSSNADRTSIFLRVA